MFNNVTYFSKHPAYQFLKAWKLFFFFSLFLDLSFNFVFTSCIYYFYKEKANHFAKKAIQS